MMEKYKENNINKDIFYEDQKREKVKAAREEAIRKKKENDERIKKEKEEQDKLSIEDKSDEPIAEESEAEVESVAVDLSKSIIQETVKNIQEEDNNVGGDIKDIEEIVSEKVEEEVVNNELDSDLKEALNEDDPWLKNKLNKDKEA
jgi:hypothetical protein